MLRTRLAAGLFLGESNVYDTSGFHARIRGGLRLLGVATRQPIVGPRVVNLEITHFCNLNCGFCESHGRFMPEPIVRRREYEGGRRTMDLETIERLCRALTRLGVIWVELSGKGDPVVHPKLPEVVRIIKKAGLRCSMFTNGSVPRPDLASTLVECGLDRLNVSLNAGSREVWARVAGKDLWENTLGFIKQVLDLRRQKGARLPWVRVSYVLCKDNVEDMGRSVAICRELEVDEGGWCVMGELPENVQLQLEQDEVDRLLTAIPEWSRRLEASGIVHDLDGLAEELPLRVTAHEQQENPMQRSLPCYEGWMHSVIGPDGTVVPCCYCEEERLGNVVEQDFVDIWRGARYRDFRRRSLALAKTQEPICWECYNTCNRALENRRIHMKLRPLGPVRPADSLIESRS